MSDSKLEPSENEFAERKPLTEEQIALRDYFYDTERDTTMNGSPRCACRYKGPDQYGLNSVWIRCMKEAKLKVLISEHGVWALVCYDCCPHSNLVEELIKRDNESRVDGGSANRLRP